MKRFWIGALAAVLACTDVALDPHEPLERLDVTPNNELILTSESLALDIGVYDTGGERVKLPPWVPVHWAADTEGATVSNGVFSSDHGGTVRITAHAAGLTGGVRVRINPAVLGVDVTLVLNQAIQDRGGTIPLIAGRDVIFRAFMTATEPNFYQSVDMQARFRLGNTVVHTTPVLSIATDVMPMEVTDDLSLSYIDRAAVPGRVIQKGLLLEVQLDPEGKLDPRLALAPQITTVAMPVIEVPVHRQLLVPTVGDNLRESIVDLAPEVATDSLALLRWMYPLKDVEIEIHRPYRTAAALNGATSGEPWIQWVKEIAALRLAEGRTDWHYLGIADIPLRTIGGVAEVIGYAAAAIPKRFVMLHEIGHNLSLLHSPCGGAPHQDPGYPYPDGTIGQWGFNILEEGVYSKRTPDVMGYCHSYLSWISDYGFKKVLNYRSRIVEPVSLSREPVVLVWGAVDEGGIELEPAFALNTVPVVPDGEGDYTLAIIGPHGDVGYTARFTPRAVSDIGGETFHFAIPYTGEIERIEVIGPAGHDVIGRGTERPLRMVWQGDEIVAMQRGWDLVPAMDGAVATRVIISDGVPR